MPDARLQVRTEYWCHQCSNTFYDAEVQVETYGNRIEEFFDCPVCKETVWTEALD